MRVALTSAYAWPEVRRGGERYLHELAAALQDAGHRVLVLAGAPRPGRHEQLGVPVTSVPRFPLRPRRYRELAPEAGYAAAALAVLAPLAAAGRVDVWHATTTADGAAAAWLGRRLPRLATGFTDHGFPAAASRARRPDAGLHRRVVDGVGAYVCVSGAAGDVLRRDFGREPVVVHPGVRLAAYRPLPRDPSPVLLYSGALDVPRKGVALLLEAAALLLPDHPDLQVQLLGPGDPAPLLAAAPPAVRARVAVAREAGDAELAERYGRAWVTVLPATAESFGMVLVESLAAGTPVVARADGGGPAEVVVPGVGALARDGDPRALAAALREALALAQEPATAVRCRARAAAFDWGTAVVPALEAAWVGARRG